MTSEVEQRPTLVTAGYGRHRRQWVKKVWFFWQQPMNIKSSIFELFFCEKKITWDWDYYKQLIQLPLVKVTCV